MPVIFSMKIDLYFSFISFRPAHGTETFLWSEIPVILLNFSKLQRKVPFVFSLITTFIVRNESEMSESEGMNFHLEIDICSLLCGGAFMCVQEMCFRFTSNML